MQNKERNLNKQNKAMSVNKRNKIIQERTTINWNNVEKKLIRESDGCQGHVN